MNDRIKELFKRAGGKTSIHNLMSNPMQQREYNELWDENIQKFAELIVKEAGKYLTSPEFIGRSDLDWSMVLKEHFGVEE